MDIPAMERRRREILEAMAELGDLRRGSVVDQFLAVSHRDGSVSRRGPYPLYTYTEGGRTVSRRLPGAAIASRVRSQIGAFRRFEALADEFVKVSHALADARLASETPGAEETPEKKRRKPSGKRSGGRSTR